MQGLYYGRQNNYPLLKMWETHFPLINQVNQNFQHDKLFIVTQWLWEACNEIWKTMILHPKEYRNLKILPYFFILIIEQF